MLSSSAASGANAPVSSSGKEETSQTSTLDGSSSPTSEVTAVPTLPATTTGTPAVRWMWPSSSAVVVFPLDPVTATNWLGSSRQPSSTSPSTGNPAARAAATTGADCGTPGLLTSHGDPPASPKPPASSAPP